MEIRCSARPIRRLILVCPTSGIKQSWRQMSSERDIHRRFHVCYIRGNTNFAFFAFDGRVKRSFAFDWMCCLPFLVQKHCRYEIFQPPSDVLLRRMRTTAYHIRRMQNLQKLVLYLLHVGKNCTFYKLFYNIVCTCVCTFIILTARWVYQ